MKIKLGSILKAAVKHRKVIIMAASLVAPAVVTKGAAKYKKIKRELDQE